MSRQSILAVVYCVLALLVVSGVRAQGPDILWQRTYGGTGGEHGYSVFPLADGGFVVAGYTQSFGAGSYDVYLVRTDAAGDSLWHRTYGGTGLDLARSVRGTSDGGFIIAGSTNSFGSGGYDVYLIKTDAGGEVTWTRTYGLTGDDYGYSVRQTSDGGYFIAGYSNSFSHGDNDGYLIRTDSLGYTIWDRTYGLTGQDYFEWVEINDDQGCILVGYTTLTTPPGSEVWVVRTRANGDTVWTREFGGNFNDYGYSGIQTADGGFIITGTVQTAISGYQLYLLKLYGDGGTAWYRYYGGADTETGYCVKQILPDEGYIISGTTESYGAGDWDVYLVRTFADGDTMWTATYGDTLRDWAREVHETPVDTYILCGSTTSYGAGAGDAYLIKTRSDPADIVGYGASEEKSLCIRAWPNPSRGAVTIAYTLDAPCKVWVAVYDISGREIAVVDSGRMGPGRHAMVWPGKDRYGRPAASGIYLIKLNAAGWTAAAKFVLLN